jgi:predicted amidophosphoribosyltransferase
MNIGVYLNSQVCKVCWKEVPDDDPCPACGLASHWKRCSDSGVGYWKLPSLRAVTPWFKLRVEGRLYPQEGATVVCLDCVLGDE